MNVDAATLELLEGRSLLDTIRAKTMKKGGVGYVQPDHGSFPKMAETNRFFLDAGAIPTVTWLNGLSQGEQDIAELLETAMSTGAAAINIIPDRNFTSGVKDKKLENLYNVVELAEELDLPVIVGTEMNSPGQKFVDDFDAPELKPLLPVFLRGAQIAYAHTVLQRKAGLGYTSKWANANFKDKSGKNQFFYLLGNALIPKRENLLAGLNKNITPSEILDTVTT